VSSISNQIKIKALRDKITEIEGTVYASLAAHGFDLDSFASEDEIIDNMGSMFNLFTTPSVRFRYGFRVWKNIPIEEQPEHWMAPTCSSTDTHMNIPMDELYGRSEFRDILMNTGFLERIVNHVVIYNIPGGASIIYNELTPGSEHLIKQYQMIHPYPGAPSLHELFKLLLEWQWAYVYADSREPMAEVANEILTSLGLHIDQQTSVEPVKSLMELPDMQVAQYFKTGTCSLPDTAPVEPTAFKLWAAKSGVLNINKKEFADIYEQCLRLKMMKEKLNILENN
jgi:hypothetical protein